MSKGRLEAEVKAGVLAYLATRGDNFCWVNNSGMLYNRNGTPVFYGSPGSSDILGLLSDGTFFGLELKREIGGVESRDQETFRENVTRHGGICVVVRSVDEAQAALGPVRARVVHVPRRKRAYHK